VKSLSREALVLALAVFGCGEPGEVPPPAVPVPEPVLSIPGTVLLPGSDGFTELSEEDQQAVLLYCWIPMGEYRESEADLHFLADLQNTGITPVPVQFSTEVRNASQNQVNGLGLQLPVALGDDSLKAFMDISMMPSAVLVTSTGETVRQNGFGCAERVVRSAR
jgi:hypothetical protein